MKPPPRQPLHAATLDAAAAIAARHYVTPAHAVTLHPVPGDPGAWDILIHDAPVAGAQVFQTHPGDRYTFASTATRPPTPDAGDWWEP